MLVSFDVVSLFTKIPINLARNVAWEQLIEDVTLSERTEMTVKDIKIALNFYLNNMHFTFQKNFYQLILGISMGSLISVTIANLVTERIEIKAMNYFFSPPKLWTIFVDDTFIIIESDVGQKFFPNINSII